MEGVTQPLPPSLFAAPSLLFAPSLLRHALGRRLWWRLHRPRCARRRGVVDRVVEVVDQLADLRGIAAEIAFEIARRGTDIDPRSVVAVRQYAYRDILAKTHDQGARHRLDSAFAARRLRRAGVDHQPLAPVDEV